MDVSDFFMSLSVLIINGIQVFVPFYFGSQLESQNEALIDQLVESDIMKINKKMRKNVSIFELNLLAALRIRILKAFSLNLKTFLKVNISLYQCRAAIIPRGEPADLIKSPFIGT